MSEVYHYTGLIIVWLSAVFGFIIVAGFIFIQTLNLLGKHFKILWKMAEYFVYRDQFREWVKDKDRIKKAE